MDERMREFAREWLAKQIDELLEEQDPETQSPAALKREKLKKQKARRRKRAKKKTEGIE